MNKCMDNVAVRTSLYCISVLNVHICIFDPLEGEIYLFFYFLHVHKINTQISLLKSRRRSPFLSEFFLCILFNAFSL